MRFRVSGRSSIPESRNRARLRRGRNFYATEGKLLVVAYRPLNHIELYVIDLVLPSVEEHLLAAPIVNSNPLYSPLSQYCIFWNLYFYIEYVTGKVVFR